MARVAATPPIWQAVTSLAVAAHVPSLCRHKFLKIFICAVVPCLAVMS
jgi:hypothetical protein